MSLDLVRYFDALVDAPDYAPDVEAMLAFIKSTSRPWRKQRDIVRSVCRYPVTVVQSSTGSGKTKIAADILLAHLFGAPDRIVITTAPTMRQVQEMLWKEVRVSWERAHKAGLKLGGHMPPRAPEIRVRDGWVAVGFSSSSPVNFQGWHSRNGTLVIIDEALGVEDETWAALEATLGGEHDRILALANPVTPRGRFFDLCTKPQAGVNVIRISAFDTPNVKEGRVVVPGLVTRAAVDRMREAWGEDSALYRSRVLGEFPDDNQRALVPLSWAMESVNQWKAMRDLTANERPEIVRQGVDVARLGRDKGVTATVRDFLVRLDKRPVSARIVDLLDVHPSADLMESAGHVALGMREAKAVTVRIDADGLGAGLYDRLNELGLPVVEMRGGRAPNDRTRFTNARSEWLWSLRESLRPHTSEGDTRPHVYLPDDEALIFQATTLEWGTTSDGRIYVETKEQWAKRMKPRNGRSTDQLDAVAMALTDDPVVGGTSISTVLAAYG